MPKTQKPTPNKKLQQFNKELDELCVHYQYKLLPRLSYSTNGIVPVLDVMEVVPSKKGVKKLKKKIEKPKKKN